MLEFIRAVSETKEHDKQFKQASVIQKPPSTSHPDPHIVVSPSDVQFVKYFALLQTPY